MFLAEFFGVTEGSGEHQVCCPFDHHTPNGIPYKETRPSAHVNCEKKVFHCMACGAGYSEAQFIQRILGCSYMDAKRLQRCFNTIEDYTMWKTETNLSEATKQRAMSFGITETVIEELDIATPTGAKDIISFPVFMYDHLVDVRNYDPGASPKVKSRGGCPVGLIIPFDKWRETPANKITILCAGEKDMAVTRSKGFNAITLTGGENTLCKTPELFRDRIVVIAYDNDDAGRNGAKSLAVQLLKYTDKVKILSKFHEICTEKGEDLTDFFTKYGKTKQDLIQYIEATEYYVPSEEDLAKHYPMLNLLKASNPQYVGRMVRSNIQVVAVADSTFVTPSAVLAEKFKSATDKDTMYVGEFKEWELCEDNCQDILHLIDSNFKEDTIEKNIKTMLKIHPTEKFVKIAQISRATVFKAVVTDLFETADSDTQPMEYTVYSLGHKLESGKKYLATYKLVPHPYKGQQLTMIITDVLAANDSVSNFHVTPEIKEQLNVFRNMTGTVEERINLLTEKVKGLLGYDGNNTLIQTLDLAYHTTLYFNFGTFKNVRGYLDTIVIGESRVGKSSTADTLRRTYELGVFTSLAGNSATIPGLIGGSNKTAGGYQTRAGIIPQNHKGLIIFEEFGKSNANVIKELTDIRSSNEVRITRVSGTMTMPAAVRMISLTNVKSTNGTIKPIAAYPNGFSILTELVDTAEDIARYDLVVILSDRGASQIDPFWRPETPFPEEVYKARVRWVWSRTPEQIQITQDVGLYIMERANALNAEYECHIKLFGTEAWKKLCRLSIAIAGYVVSTDDSYENIIITKEHVDYAEAFFKRIYDNPTFKLKEYVIHEKRYSEIDEDGVAFLQDLFNKFPSLILQLEQSATVSKPMLSAATGLANDELNKALNLLSRGLFVRFQNHDIMPTERFRLGLAKLERNIHARRVGE